MNITKELLSSIWHIIITGLWMCLVYYYLGNMTPSLVFCNSKINHFARLYSNCILVTVEIDSPLFRGNFTFLHQRFMGRPSLHWMVSNNYLLLWANDLKENFTLHIYPPSRSCRGKWSPSCPLLSADFRNKNWSFQYSLNHTHQTHCLIKEDSFISDYATESSYMCMYIYKRISCILICIYMNMYASFLYV